MRAIAQAFGLGSRTVSYMLGGLVLAMAVIVGTTAANTVDVASWAKDVLGMTFVLLLGTLIFTAVLSWVKMTDKRTLSGQIRTWLEVGMQASNGITTLALTYTLFGISLGIGTLSEATLTPDTIHEVIRALTANFSLAFMTTVVGLPVSALLRSLLAVTYARIEAATVASMGKFEEISQ